MFKVVCFCLALASTPCLWSQVEPSATGGELTLDDTRMMTPPPVNGAVYPRNVGAETKSNYLAGGLVFTGAYNDNIMIDPARKIADSNYSITPTISIDRRTPSDLLAMSYSAGFTFYQKTTGYNGVTQDGIFDYEHHLSRYSVLSLRDALHQNYNLFNQANPFVGTGVSAGAPSPTSVYVFPFQNQIGNSVDGSFEYQYAKNAMIGAGGNYAISRYQNLSGTSGLNDSDATGASAFWNRRLSRGDYLGATYGFSRITTQPIETTTDVHTVYGFYTHYITPRISFSVLAGPQHIDSRDAASGAEVIAWKPSGQGSVGYQTTRSNFAINYARTIGGASGLAGAYQSDIASAEIRQQLSRTWNVGAGGNYALFKNVTPAVSNANPGGHTVSGTASLRHNFGEQIVIEVGYSRFHQSYNNSGFNTLLYPDANREFGSVMYQFHRPLGR